MTSLFSQSLLQLFGDAGVPAEEYTSFHGSTESRYNNDYLPWKKFQRYHDILSIFVEFDFRIIDKNKQRV